MTRRALMLAGGGLKVAAQAGALQVWLDEAGIEFDLADGASGGVFNLAMWSQGMSGQQIADNWRDTHPADGIDFRWTALLNPFYAESFFTLDAFRENIFPAWGLDFTAIRASTREAYFNVYNFSRHRNQTVVPGEMTPEMLTACVSLPMFFPPVTSGKSTLIDSVFFTDSNIEHAIERGADELWIIWTVSERGEWLNGFVANYFQIIEAAANGHLGRQLQRIERSNAAITAGTHSEFERPITVKMLKMEVPLHYLLNLTQDRVRSAVNLGVRAARDWCAREGIPLRAVVQADEPAAEHPSPGVRFTEEMKGFYTPQARDYDAAYRLGRESGRDLSFHATIHIDDVDRFVGEPDHVASIEGWVTADGLGNHLQIERGIFNLFVHDDDPRKKRMLYRLWFSDDRGRPTTLAGFKEIEDNPGIDVWHDLTTLFVTVSSGHLDGTEEGDAAELGRAILRIHLVPDFLRQLLTFRSDAADPLASAAAIAKFGRFFLGSVWDVYGTRILTASPF